MQKRRNAISINPTLHPTKSDWLNQSDCPSWGRGSGTHQSIKKSSWLPDKTTPERGLLDIQTKCHSFPSLNEETERLSLFYKSHPITTQMYISFWSQHQLHRYALCCNEASRGRVFTLSLNWHATCSVTWWQHRKHLTRKPYHTLFLWLGILDIY